MNASEQADELELKLMEALRLLEELFYAVDEDVPHEYRTKHLNMALEDALVLLFPEEEDEVETPCRSHYPDFDHYCHEKGQGCRREEVER